MILMGLLFSREKFSTSNALAAVKIHAEHKLNYSKGMFGNRLFSRNKIFHESYLEKLLIIICFEPKLR